MRKGFLNQKRLSKPSEEAFETTEREKAFSGME